MSKLRKGLHLHFDPLSGIAGDMTVAALVDAGVPRAVIAGAIAGMKVPGLKVGFERRQRGAYVGTGFTVRWPGSDQAALDHDHDHDHDHNHDHDHDHDHDHEHDPHALLRPPQKPRPKQKPARKTHDDHHRDYAEIRRLLRRAGLDKDVEALAGEIFARIAEAESTLHGVPVDRIAFHEVGAYDSIADIVGVAAGIVWLAPASVSSSPPVVGTGHTRTAHGLVPIPAPATALLLEGIPTVHDGRGELTTPTGAGVLAAVVDHFGAAPPMRLVAQGFGAGTKDFADRANVLRVMLGEPLGAPLPAPAEEVLLIETNVDDMSPQLVAPLFDALFAAGAVDAWATPILMKKGRPALTLSALAPPAAAEAVTTAFFAHSSSIGVRTLPVGRSVLARSAASVTTPYGKVAVKLSAAGGRVLSATPEFDDCRRLAEKAKVPVRLVHGAASAAAQAFLEPPAAPGKRPTRR